MITVDKYTFSQDPMSREIAILRHGKTWVKFSPASTVGFNAVAALMYQAEEIVERHRQWQENSTPEALLLLSVAIDGLEDAR